MFIPTRDDIRPYLAADDGETAGGGTDETSENNANTGGETGGSESDQPAISFKDEKSFMIRIKREANSQLAARAKELGFDSVADMEAAVKAAKAKTEADKSELDKAREAAAKAEDDRVATLERANDRLIRAEVKSIASDLQIIDSDAAYLLMGKEDVAVDDGGNVSGVKESLEALLKAKPFLRKSDGAASRSGGEFNGNDGNKSSTSMNRLIRQAAGRE